MSDQSKTSVEIEEPYMFVPANDRIPTAAPREGKVPQLFWRLASGGELTREEKDYLFHNIVSQLHGKFGTYRVAGWAFPFGQFFKRFVVHYDNGNWAGDWIEYWAPDRTALRSSFYTNRNIDEIHELPKKDS